MPSYWSNRTWENGFTYEDIANSHFALTSIPGNITQHQQVVNSTKQSLMQIESRLVLANGAISRLEEAIAGCDAALRLPTVSARLAELRDKKQVAESVLRDFEAQLQNMNEIIRPANDEIEQLSRAIDNHEMNAQLKLERVSLAMLLRQIESAQAALDLVKLGRNANQFIIQDAAAEIRGINRELNILNFQQTVDVAHHANHYQQHHYADPYHGQIVYTAHPCPTDSIVHYFDDAARQVRINQLHAELELQYRKQTEQQAIDENAKREDDKLESSLMSLKAKLHTCETNISRMENELRHVTLDTRNVPTLKNLLRNKRQFVTPYVEQKELLEAKIEMQRELFMQIASQLKTQENSARQLARTSQDFNRLSETELLAHKAARNAELPPFIQERTELLNQRAAQRNIVNTHEQQIAQFEADLTAINNNTYLAKLRSEPHTLYHELAISLKEKIKTYESQNPANQSQRLRLALIKMQGWLDDVNLQVVPNTAYAVERYFQFSGLIRTIQEGLAASAVASEQAFSANSLQPLLMLHPLDRLSAVNAYHLLYQTIPTDSPIKQTLEQMLANEKEQGLALHQKISAFVAEHQDGMVVLSQLRQNALAVADSIYELISAAKTANDDNFDFKYHNRILERTYDLLLHPGNEELRREYGILASQQQAGQASLWKKITGLMFAFLGTAIAAAGITSTFMTFGISTAYSWTTVASGTAMLLAGIGLFRSGYQKGAAKNMATYLKEANNHQIDRSVNP